MSISQQDLSDFGSSFFAISLISLTSFSFIVIFICFSIYLTNLTKKPISLNEGLFQQFKIPFRNYKNFNFFHMQELKIGSGLNNLGNTCFFNAVLQSVLHTKKLAAYFSNKNHSKNCHNNEWCVFCQMEKTYHTTRSNKVYSPYNLVNNLKKIFKKFKLGRQEDSHQFLRYLIEGMQDCQTGKLGKDREKNQASIKKTKIFNIFGGIIKNVVLCLHCKHKSITKERYYDLNIECQKSNSLDEGLQRFFAVDELKGQNKYLCQSCKNRVDATKRFYLQTAPQTLTFQLKRFTNTLRKLGKFIKYPKFIHLGKYFDHERKTVARLSAVIVHAGGSASSGHYYSYVRVGQNWFRMDDSYVTKCSEQQAMAQNAYILMYEKVKDQALEKQSKQQLKEEVTQKKQQQKSKVQTQKVKQQEKVQGISKKPEQQNRIFEKTQNEGEKANSNDTLKSVKTLNQTMQSEHMAPENNQFKRPTPSGQESDEDIPIPGSLQRKRSKLEAEQSMPLQELILKYAFKLQNLQSKLPPAHSTGHRVLRSIHTLRKMQISMKRRKIM